MHLKGVLLIDDQSQWYTACQLLCDDFGCSCTWAATLGEARDRLNDALFDALILDLDFPEREDLLLPPDVREVDLLIGRLEQSPKTLNILLCTGLADTTKVALVQARLGRAGHNVRLFKKGNDVAALYEAFAQTIGMPKRAETPPSVQTTASGGLVLLAFACAFCLVVSAIWLSPKFLPAGSNALFARAFVGAVGSFMVAASLVVFWKLGMLKPRDVIHLLDRAVDFAESVVRPRGVYSTTPRGGARGRRR